jgi:hypothetical protein
MKLSVMHIVHDKVKNITIICRPTIATVEYSPVCDHIIISVVLTAEKLFQLLYTNRRYHQHHFFGLVCQVGISGLISLNTHV